MYYLTCYLVRGFDAYIPLEQSVTRVFLACESVMSLRGTPKTSEHQLCNAIYEVRLVVSLSHQAFTSPAGADMSHFTSDNDHGSDDIPTVTALWVATLSSWLRRRPRGRSTTSSNCQARPSPSCISSLRPPWQFSGACCRIWLKHWSWPCSTCPRQFS